MKAPRDTTAVELLLDMEPETLVEEHWCTRHAQHHGALARLATFLDAPELESIDALIESHEGCKTRIVLADAQGKGHFRANVTAREAQSLFRSGLVTVCLDDIDTHVRPLRRLLDRIADEIGISRSETHCNAYCSQRGGGFAQHWDAQEVLVIQLLGSKVWEVASAAYYVPWPRSNYLVKTDGRRREFQDVAHPDLMPPGAERVVMRPGSALFLPRGYWHRTEADSETPSLSLTVYFVTPTWGDIMAGLLAREFAGTSWREPAVGIRARRFDARSRAKLDERIRCLASRITPGTWPGPVGALMTRDPEPPDDDMAVFEFTAADAAIAQVDGECVLTVAEDEVAIDEETRAAVEAVLGLRRGRSAFALNELAEVHNGRDPAVLREVLGLLLASGLLRMRAP